jgi:hypothetical protein
MIKAILALVGALCIVGFGAGFALAGPQFFGTPYAATLATSGPNTCDLTVGPIDERGLGTTNVDYVLSAQAAVGLACQNRGGNFPTDPKKQGAAGAASDEESIKPKNGRIRNVSFTIDITDQDFVPALNCPGGQVAVLVCCQYTSIALTDTTNNVTASVTPSSLALNTAPDLFAR